MNIAFSTWFLFLSAFIEARANAFVERQLSRIAGGVNKQKIF